MDTIMELPDATLLERFAQQRDEAAFAELVERHGPMVRATCVRVLGRSPDIDDAFQAVFLVLARKVGDISHRQLLGPWLYTVALRTARKALALRQRRRTRERTGTAMPEPAARAETPSPDWLGLIDDLLEGLPAKHRDPIVLCDLQGVGRSEAAEQLGIPEGTLSSRLARGRELLRKQLLRRGVVVGAVALAMGLASQASADVPPSLVASTVHAAAHGATSPAVASLTQGVLQAMKYAKLKSMLIVAVALLVCLGAGVAALTQLIAQPAAAQAKTDKERLQGEWQVAKAVRGDQELGEKEVEKMKKGRFIFEGDTLTTRAPCDYKLDPSKKPAHFDLTPRDGPDNEKGKLFAGIYELKGDELKLSFRDRPDDPRPESFGAEGAMHLTLRRIVAKK